MSSNSGADPARLSLGTAERPGKWKVRASFALLSTTLTYTPSYLRPDLGGCRPDTQVRPNADKSAEISCSEKSQQLRGVKISAAGAARNSVHRYLDRCIALPLSSALSSDPSSRRAENWLCVFEGQERFKYWGSKLLCEKLPGLYIRFALVLLLLRNSTVRNWGEKQHCWLKPKYTID